MKTKDAFPHISDTERGIAPSSGDGRNLLTANGFTGGRTVCSLINFETTYIIESKSDFIQVGKLAKSAGSNKARRR